MKKLFILCSIFCLIVGLSTSCIAAEALTIKGDIRVEYDNWLSRDKPQEKRKDALYLERVMLKFLYNPGTNTTATVVARCDGDNWNKAVPSDPTSKDYKKDLMNTSRVDFYIYNAFVKHAVMDNQLAFTLGKFNIHVPTVYGIRGPNTYSYFYFTKEKKNGAMASFSASAMPELNLNLALIDEDQTDAGNSRPYTLYLNGTYKPIDPLSIFIGVKRAPEFDNNNKSVYDLEYTLAAKYVVDKLTTTLEYYQEAKDSKKDADKSVINLGASYQVTDTIKPYLAVELIDDGVDNTGPESNIIAGASYKASENLTYSLEIDNTMDEDSNVDDQTKIGLLARYTF